MTWNEFKKSVDETIADGGFTGDFELTYIDIRNRDVNDLTVGFHTKNKTILIDDT